MSFGREVGTEVRILGTRFLFGLHMTKEGVRGVTKKVKMANSHHHSHHHSTTQGTPTVVLLLGVTPI